MAPVLSPSAGVASSLALPAVLAPAAWIAVQEYGRRLDYALHGYELQERAEAKQTLFDGSYGLLQYAPGWVGGVASFAVPYLGRAMGADGRWDNGSRGPALGADDAVAAAAAANAARARQVYDRTLGVLGLPAPPTSPVIPWWKPGCRRGQRSPRPPTRRGRRRRPRSSASSPTSCRSDGKRLHHDRRVTTRGNDTPSVMINACPSR